MGIDGVNKGRQGSPLRNVNFQLTIDLRGNLITLITSGGPRPPYKETHYGPIKRVQGRFPGNQRWREWNPPENPLTIDTGVGQSIDLNVTDDWLSHWVGSSCLDVCS